MPVLRRLLLWGSQNKWMRERFPRYGFVRRAVRKFMPGEALIDAIDAAGSFIDKKISVILTHLGENITTPSEAEAVKRNYLEVLEQVHKNRLRASISLKLTQLGFDLSEEDTYQRFSKIAERARALDNFVWIDMEDSSYTGRSIDFYRRVRSRYTNTGLCLQAYLYRTTRDIEELLEIRPNLRLVKGAYMESETVAFAKRSQVDANYFQLARTLMPAIKDNQARVIFATHDEKLLERIIIASQEFRLKPDQLEFNMLFGIKPSFQISMAAQGFRIGVLISYGTTWFPWYMRRLAERPANLWFVLKNMFRR